MDLILITEPIRGLIQNRDIGPFEFIGDGETKDENQGNGDAKKNHQRAPVPQDMQAFFLDEGIKYFQHDLFIEECEFNALFSLIQLETAFDITGASKAGLV